MASPARRWGRVALSITGILTLLAGLAYVAMVQLDMLPSPVQRQPAPFPPPAATRDGRWQQDVAYLADQLPYLHRNAFFQLPEERFRADVAALDARIPTSSDAEIMLGLAALAASLGDGHTSVDLFEPAMFRTFPLQLAWYGDDLVVIGAHPDYHEAIAARVTHIGATPVAEALALVTPYIAHDNEQQIRSASPRFLLSPEILAALKILPDASSGRFQFETAAGEALTLELTPVAADTPFDAVNLYDATAIAKPLRVQQDAMYWYTYLPESRAIYFQYNRCADDPERPFETFNRELFTLVDNQPVDRLIIDLRFNGGGNSAILQPFINAIRERPDLNQEGKIYVLIGARTFSSALMNAIELQDDTAAILLGEQTGGRPNGYGEVREFELPNSGLRVRYSTRFFTNLPGSDTPGLNPDLYYPIAWTDLLNGVDPAVDAAIAGVIPERR